VGLYQEWSCRLANARLFGQETKKTITNGVGGAHAEFTVNFRYNFVHYLTIMQVIVCNLPVFRYTG